MLAADILDQPPISPGARQSPTDQVMLADGSRRALTGLDGAALQQLQWEQEQKFAHAIKVCPPGSRERALVTGQAYDTICTLLAAQAELTNSGSGDRLLMGHDPRYSKLVLKLLEQQVNQGFGRPQLFEVGYGSGAMLEAVSGLGYRVGGIEVSSTMHERAKARLGARHADSLLLGNVRSVTREQIAERPTMIFWNDVWEHIPEDEIGDYVSKLYELLDPRGWLVTITPNWLLRPSDVTADFCPPRTEARGLHLKEYRLSEVVRHLKQAGFRRIATPLASTRRQFVLCGGGGRLLKQWIEPLLDKLPVRVAHLACRGLAMSCTIAAKK